MSIPTTTLTRSLRRLPRSLPPPARSLTPLLHPRHYHDPTAPSPAPYPPTETAILTASLLRVPTSGFTPTTLTLGARDAGFLDVSTNLLPNGVFDLVLFHLATRRLALRSEVQFVEGEGELGVGERVRGLLWARLRGNEAVVGRLHEALAIMAQPTHIPASLTALFTLSSDILHLAGDTSLDTAWYTKRASTGALYAAAELYQTQDQSTDFRDTARFLDDRLEELRVGGEALGDVGEWVGYAGRNLVNVMRSRGVRV
ncbi:ubiquinone biosynthesis protein COQ9 [Eremomyces bilateralis CBS 781.70]|uniref:Ubiquinone biosynthesis protein n=1 Tax=Eremomyces bilateralis CBS 781.70 TaxID=1392243 RepID=A0A6G1FYG4_9PEZI|nr:ubiquinone biosynthesis protein COQ9 [Eremomyces bilateralis CBS 781.70]KAF1810814.1 ubiquinone biosynthesis protein COQ9 [Eremomyces bilateralis CBS 781.70]